MKQAEHYGGSREILPLHLRRGSGAKVRTLEQRREAADRRRARLERMVARPMVDVGFVLRAELAARVGVSERTLREWTRSGRIVPPLRLSERVVAYPADVARQIVKDLAKAAHIISAGPHLPSSVEVSE
jgi:hypothetical protein